MRSGGQRIGWITSGLIAFALAGCGTSDEETGDAQRLSDRTKVEMILATLDQTTLPAEQLADLYHEDAVILQPGQPEVRGRNAIIDLMNAQAAGPALDMEHRIDDYSAFAEIIVVQGGVTGTGQPETGEPFEFATKNVIIFKRDGDEEPKIWKVIFNNAPA
ncbi:MAG: nuclear transport factor 2 family protein [Pseudomonadota bacterium]